MPVYVYKNLNTNETFELKQSISEDALKVHPETGDPVMRVVQPVGIAFKGSGFYVNDSKATNGKTNAKTESSTDTADTKSEAKADSKTDTKSEASSKTDSKPAKKSEAKPAAKAD